MVMVLAVVSVVLAVVIVLVVAYHLIGIFLALRNTAIHLEALAGGLKQVESDTAPLNARIDTINAGLSALLAPLMGANDNLAKIVEVASTRR